MQNFENICLLNLQFWRAETQIYDRSYHYTDAPERSIKNSRRSSKLIESTPSVIFQMFSFLVNLEDYQVGTRFYNVFIVSIAVGILGASVALPGLHYKAGSRLSSWQFGVINLHHK